MWGGSLVRGRLVIRAGHAPGLQCWLATAILRATHTTSHPHEPTVLFRAHRPGPTWGAHSMPSPPTPPPAPLWCYTAAQLPFAGCLNAPTCCVANGFPVAWPWLENIGRLGGPACAARGFSSFNGCRGVQRRQESRARRALGRASGACTCRAAPLKRAPPAGPVIAGTSPRRREDGNGRVRLFDFPKARIPRGTARAVLLGKVLSSTNVATQRCVQALYRPGSARGGNWDSGNAEYVDPPHLIGQTLMAGRRPGTHRLFRHTGPRTR